MTNDTHTHTHTTRCYWAPDQARWVCRSAVVADTVADADTPLVDVRDMLVVHTALLREFRLAGTAVGRVAPGDVRQAGVVDRHLAFVCGMLHHHHEGEDTLLWPLLRERVPDSVLRTLEAVEAQHQGIEDALAMVGTSRTDWVSGAGAHERDALVAGLQHLHLLLEQHLELEENAVLPVAASVLSVAEWSAVGEAAAAAMPKPDLVLAFGMFAYEGDPAVLRTMLASAPAVPRFVVPRIAPRVYARRAQRVHGTSRP